MFLFSEDYAFLPSDHFDHLTPNKSFIRMHLVLKKMGIANNKFFLVILDKELKGIDPYDLKDDSMELKLRIAQECKTNPWYFFRSMLRVPAAGSAGTPFQLSRANLSMIWLYFNHVDNLLIMPRQLGKTIGSIAIAACIIYVLGDHIKFAMLTKDTALRKENVGRLKDMRDCFPDWFLHKQRVDVNNTESLSYEALTNEYITFVAQESLQGAERLGRGMTVPSQHWDEIAFFANIATTYPIAISTTNAAIESAQANGQPYGNILTTTAGVLNTDEGQFTHNLICNSLTFTERLYDLKDNANLLDVVKTNSKQGMVYSEFSYLQLGKTHEWFQEKADRTAGGEEIIARDYLNKWTFGTYKSPIDKKYLDALYSGKQDPCFIQYIDNFMIKWYIPESVVRSEEFNNIPIAIGMDASENIGRDYTSFVFGDCRNLGVIATCSCNTSNIIKVAMFVCKWLMHKNVIYIPERNSVGVAILDYCLLRLEELGINPFMRIFNNIVQDFGTNKDISRADISRPGFYNEHRREFGFRTSGATRPFLYKTVFKQLMETSCPNVRDISLISQIAGLTVKNGRIDHRNGGHDDSVIAFILIGYLLFFGNNLDMYDFSAGQMDNLLKNLASDPDSVENKDSIEEQKIESLRHDIAKAEREIRYATHATTKIEMIHKLQDLKTQLPKENEDTLLNIQSLTQLKPKKPQLVGDTDQERRAFLCNYFSGL